MTKLYIEVEADTSDADYIYQRTEITEEDLIKLLPIVSVIKNIGVDHNWPNNEYAYNKQDLDSLYIDSKLLSRDQMEMFNEYIPYGEIGIHTIKSIKLLKIIEEEELL